MGWLVRNFDAMYSKILKCDRVRVKYHSDKLKLWHRRFRMDYYGNLAKPVETTEVWGGWCGEAGVLQLAAAG